MTNPEIGTPPEGRTIIDQTITLNQLLQRLVDADLPVDEYGKGVAKTVQHLLAEVADGESVISFDQQNKLYRHVNVLWADVFCTLSNGEKYRLTEDRQEFKDGRVKRRSLNSSIGEKLKPNEDPEIGAMRALQEELGISAVESLTHIGDEETTYMPDTYPGLESTYSMHKYVAIIPESEFVSEGYVEYQTDKTNYYVWELVD